MRSSTTAATDRISDGDGHLVLYDAGVAAPAIAALDRG
jgi:hypothetical protein